MNYKLIARGRHTYTTPRPGQYLKHPIQQLSHVLCGAGALLGREGSMRHGLTRRLCHADDPNKGETAVHGFHCRGDVDVRMRKVLAIPWSWYLRLSS